MSEYRELDLLIDGIKSRSDAAFAEVYRITGEALASFAYSMLRDRPSAEDAVQQAFLELVRAAPSIRGDGRSLRAWSFRSVRFSCLDEIRRSGRRPDIPADEMPERVDVADADPLLGLDSELEAALAQLTEQQRNLIVLRHVAGLSGAEAAKVMDMKRPAAYAATSRAEKRLRMLLEYVEYPPLPASQPRRIRRT